MYLVIPWTRRNSERRERKDSSDIWWSLKLNLSVATCVVWAGQQFVHHVLWFWSILCFYFELYSSICMWFDFNRTEPTFLWLDYLSCICNCICIYIYIFVFDDVFVWNRLDLRTAAHWLISHVNASTATTAFASCVGLFVFSSGEVKILAFSNLYKWVHRSQSAIVRLFLFSSL